MPRPELRGETLAEEMIDVCLMPGGCACYGEHVCRLALRIRLVLGRTQGALQDLAFDANGPMQGCMYALSASVCQCYRYVCMSGLFREAWR